MDYTFTMNTRDVTILITLTPDRDMMQIIEPRALNPTFMEFGRFRETVKDQLSYNEPTRQYIVVNLNTPYNTVAPENNYDLIQVLIPFHDALSIVDLHDHVVKGKVPPDFRNVLRINTPEDYGEAISFIEAYHPRALARRPFTDGMFTIIPRHDFIKAIELNRMYHKDLIRNDESRGIPPPSHYYPRADDSPSRRPINSAAASRLRQQVMRVRQQEHGENLARLTIQALDQMSLDRLSELTREQVEIILNRVARGEPPVQLRDDPPASFDPKKAPNNVPVKSMNDILSLPPGTDDDDEDDTDKTDEMIKSIEDMLDENECHK